MHEKLVAGHCLRLFERVHGEAIPGSAFDHGYPTAEMAKHATKHFLDMDQSLRALGESQSVTEYRAIEPRQILVETGYLFIPRVQTGDTYFFVFSGQPPKAEFSRGPNKSITERAAD